MIRAPLRAVTKISIFGSLEASSDSKSLAMPASYVIGERFESFIKTLVEQGRYASASEVIREALRALEEREQFRAMKLEALRAEIERGTQSGPGIPTEEVFAKARRRIANGDSGGSAP